MSGVKGSQKPPYIRYFHEVRNQNIVNTVIHPIFSQHLRSKYGRSRDTFVIFSTPGVKVWQKPWNIRYFWTSGGRISSKLWHIHYFLHIWGQTIAKTVICSLFFDIWVKVLPKPWYIRYFLHIWGQTIAKAVIHSLFFNIWVQLLQKNVIHSFLGTWKVPHPCQAPKTFKIRRFLY